ncbi:hypothetical protein [Methanoregula sp.]|uniref:hypothetical protein n=1 Tax=Methanoregula sp. TaxID=2052170 RepID=UPI000CC671D8|nr:hypothetical protein [Methanoregula sp.]PKG32321.1 MAG: hypothetical protein CW742_08790 [Methanoregula sp.]
MKVRQMIDTVLTDSKELGTFGLPEILRVAAGKGFFGLAVARSDDAIGCLAFVRGEPGGAIFSDENGDLFGDKAVILVTRMEQFVLYTVQPDIAEALVMGCRIFDTTRVQQGLTEAIPEIGIKSEGVGRLTVVLVKENEPQKGIRLTIRKDGRILGSDFTDGAGSAGFRLMYGDYECIVQDKSQEIRAFALHFRETGQKILIEL